MWCQCPSCGEWYHEEDAGTCKECYAEICKEKEELKRQLDDTKRRLDDAQSRLLFLDIPSPTPDDAAAPHCGLLLYAVPSSGAGGDGDAGHTLDTRAVPAHRFILASRSRVFKAMLENGMEESRSGVIKICDVSYHTLRAFVHYMYTAVAPADEQMATELLVLAEKYEVKHLKAYCQEVITSKVNNDNAITYYAFAHRHRAEKLQEASLSVLMDSMYTLAAREEYKELFNNDPKLLLGIYEAYVNQLQLNTAAGKDTDWK